MIQVSLELPKNLKCTPISVINNEIIKSIAEITDTHFVIFTSNTLVNPSQDIIKDAVSKIGFEPSEINGVIFINSECSRDNPLLYSTKKDKLIRLSIILPVPEIDYKTLNVFDWDDTELVEQLNGGRSIW